MITKYTEYIKEGKSNRARVIEKRQSQNDIQRKLISLLDDDKIFYGYLDKLLEEESTGDFIAIINNTRNFDLFDKAFDYILNLLIKNKNNNDFIIKYLFFDNYEYFLQETSKSEENFKVLIKLIKMNLNNNGYYFDIIRSLIYSQIEFYNKIEKEIPNILDIKRLFNNKKEYENYLRDFNRDIIRTFEFCVKNNKYKEVYEIIDLSTEDMFNELYINLNFEPKLINYLLDKYKNIDKEKINNLIYIIVNYHFNYETRDTVIYNKLKNLIEYFSDYKFIIDKNKVINNIKNLNDDTKNKILSLFFGNKKITCLQYFKLNKGFIYDELHYKKSDEHLKVFFDLLKDNVNKIWNNVKYLFVDNYNYVYLEIYNWLDKYDLVKYIPTQIIILLNYIPTDNLLLIKSLIEKYFDVINKEQILKFFRIQFKNQSRFNFTTAYTLDIELKRANRTYNSFINYDNYKELIDWFCLKCMKEDGAKYYVIVKNLISDKNLLVNYQYLDDAKNFDLI